jgi:hypothetical protein
MDVEPQVATAGLVIEIEAAIAEVQVPGWVKGVVNHTDDLPIDMGADPETADIAVGGQSEAVAEIPVIAPADQRVGPAIGAV